MRKLGILVFPVLLFGCKTGGENEESTGTKRTRETLKEVTLENDSRYVYKKIYVKDKLGQTHEILTATPGYTAVGGVYMLELCVYKE